MPDSENDIRFSGSDLFMDIQHDPGQRIQSVYLEVGIANPGRSKTFIKPREVRIIRTFKIKGQVFVLMLLDELIDQICHGTGFPALRFHS